MEQTIGKILLGGNFGMVGGQPRQGIARLNADGTVDPTFNPGPDGNVYALAIQADGKILTGAFSTRSGGNRATILLD
jgi:uncharacterized membrane protein